MRKLLTELIVITFDAASASIPTTVTSIQDQGALTMTQDWPIYVALFLGLWSAIVGGVFSAFSEFVMRGLLRAEPAGGIEAMQHINRTVLGTQFVAGILLIAPMSIAFAVYAMSAIDGAAKLAVISASVVYVPSVLLMTMFGNVPMNNRLDRFDYRSSEAESYWRTYGRVWTRLNHVRTLGSVLTAGLYLVAAINLVA